MDNITENKNQQEQVDDKNAFTFLTEKIKDKPINKRRVVIRLASTIGFAIIFGLTAAMVYTVAVRHAGNFLYPESLEPVTISDNSEEAAVSGSQVISENSISDDVEKEEPKEQVINQIVEHVDVTVDDYEKLYEALNEIATQAGKSVVTVTSVSSDTDWFQNTYENKNQGAGLIIAENGKELLILADRALTENAQKIDIQFQDGTQAEAILKKYDANTDLAIVGIDLDEISDKTQKNLEMAEFGNSSAPALVGKNIIAIGSPLGIQNSISYGHVTSNSEIKQMTDTDAHIITTDIYGSKSGSGVLVNLKGEVVGVITQNFTDSNTQNLIMALGISDIKTSIERMSNGQDRALLGILGTDVTETAKEELGIPEGTYVTEIVMDSPAMQAGIQSGDVITKVGTTEILNFSDFKAAMEKSQPGDTSVITVQRFAKGEYTEMSFEVTLDTLK